MSEETFKDRFETELDEKIKKLRDCQRDLGFISCMHCDKIFECNIRKSYVDAAYDSMSKGQSGGFDF